MPPADERMPYPVPAPARAIRRAAALGLVLVAAGSAGALADETGGTESGSTTASATVAGFDVAALQRALGVAADGVIGPRTRRAIRRFQRRRGLPVTGRADAATLRALGVRRLRSTGSRVSARLRAIARCESGGDPTAVSPDGRYRGKYQFSRATWRALGGTGDPAAAPEAEQDRRAAMLMRRQGPSAWPACARATG